MSPPRTAIRTDRLVLRPTFATDAERAFEIQSDWEVTRMLRMASFPADRQATFDWFADHEREWSAGEAYRFAVELGGRMVGLVDVDEIKDGEGDLGYWFERVAWGRGYAFEAANAVVRFAFGEIGLSTLKSGHAADNPASGRVLAKLGFVPVDIVERFSRPRGEPIQQCRYVLACR
ncbi:GNAT family N-acetyltransferase [Neorhizobium sp. Rsf11]|uniref:GNAT family N-acetyltransferase n=1 Tax=Neorhizobium phenanthreniclasticum TaxID=3157917 RepID=A0ABV0MAQ8_9HYPH